MSILKVYDKAGSSVGELEVDDKLLELHKGNQAVKDAVVAYLAAQRAGTASTLRKGEVAGSNKKPWRQKGTGRARAGLRQSPVWRGGGVAFGPHPRDFAQKINKKVMKLAFRRALSDKIAAGAVKIVDEITVPEAKTKIIRGLRKALGLTRFTLFVVDKVDKNLSLASRNISDVEVAAAKDVNVYQIVRCHALVISKAGMDGMQARLADVREGA